MWEVKQGDVRDPRRGAELGVPVRRVAKERGVREWACLAMRVLSRG